MCVYIYIYLYVYFGEGNGNPLQYSCLENPVDGGAWWAAVYGVAQSRTRLKLLSCLNSLFFYLLKETVVSWYNFPQMLGRIHYNSSGPGAYVLEGY